MGLVQPTKAIAEPSSCNSNGARPLQPVSKRPQRLATLRPRRVKKIREIWSSPGVDKATPEVFAPQIESVRRLPNEISCYRWTTKTSGTLT